MNSFETMALVGVFVFVVIAATALLCGLLALIKYWESCNVEEE